jgi:hypothetical protein
VFHCLPGSKARALYRNFRPANKRETPQIDTICEVSFNDPGIQGDSGGMEAPALTITTGRQLKIQTRLARRTGHEWPVLRIQQG